MSADYKSFSLAALFRLEAEGQLAALTTSLLALEKGGDDPVLLEEMMRAAHSLKGAARIVGLDPAVRVAHVMEDAFVAAQKGELQLAAPHLDQLMVGVDLLTRIAATPEAEIESWSSARAGEIDAFLAALQAAVAGRPAPAEPAAPLASAATAEAAPPAPAPPPAPPPEPPPAPAAAKPGPDPIPPAKAKTPTEARPAALASAPFATTTAPFAATTPGATAAPSGTTAPFGASAPSGTTAPFAAGGDARYLRVTADNLNRLLGLAAESLVESRWLRPFGVSVGRMKRLHTGIAGVLDRLRAEVNAGAAHEQLAKTLAEAQLQLGEARAFLVDRLDELDTHDRRSTHLSHRLYGEALAVRMRPLADGIGGFPRMVRDVARQLGKEARFEVVGETIHVDRDILNKLEAPLGHLLRNALDHGIEPPADRVAAGKAPAGIIRLEAHHSAGKLLITVSDDGRGVDFEHLRASIVRKKLAMAETASHLSEAELLEFLFLPGFSTKDSVTDISGRGVGLDVVQSMIKAVRGAIRVSSTPGQGMRFTLQLPLTLSVVRALLVEIAGEPYAFPLGFLARTLRVPAADVSATEGRQHFAFEGRQVGLVPAHEVLGRPPARRDSGDLPVVVVGDGEHRYALVVEKFLGEHELVVQPLDTRLGKIKDIAAAALMENGEPVLILDVEDLVRSIEKTAAAGGRPGSVQNAASARASTRKRVLVVDDSLTVRELERKLLESQGYEVEIALDGMDGWNAVRAGSFDLVVSDVDMPRLDGIELTRLIRADPKLRTLPVMIVSYKDREEDRRRGLDAGADYYLTKGGFQDTTMIDAVRDLIGGASEAAP